jgi:ATP-dependent DNA helicase PIF1
MNNLQFQGNRIFIPGIKMRPSDGTYPFDLTRKQFPVRPCFGITFNKLQRQTLERVGVSIDRPFFSHRQYYVGKSRVGTKSGLRILITVGVYQGKTGVWTNNVVYPEVLDLGD